MVKEDLDTSISEIFFGTSIGLAGEFLTIWKLILIAHEFVINLGNHFDMLRLVNASNHSKKSTFVFKELKTCSHVFVRVDATKITSTTLYGPYLIKNDLIRHLL